MVLDELTEVGLTPSEAKIYVALLELGSATNAHVEKRTGMQSSTVYYGLNALVEKGFAAYAVEGKARVFRPTDPHGLLDVVDRQREELDDKKARLEQVIPALAKRHPAVERQHAVMYEGERGVRAAFTEFLRAIPPGGFYYAINLGPEYLTSDDARRFLRAFHARRSKQRVRARILTNPEMLPAMKTVLDGLRHFEVRTSTDTMPLGILVYGERTLELVWQDKPTAFTIHSRVVAERHTAYCEKLWAKATVAFKG